VLDNNFVETEGVGSGIFQQVIGVAMGTSFSVVFAIIFMIHLETPIIEKYDKWILVFKRAIDDLLFIWQGPKIEFENMKQDFNSANSRIKFDWGKLARSAVFLDINLDFSIVDHSNLFIKSRVFCKPGNAFSYLQPDSFHPRHNFRGWIRGLLIRNITRTNTLDNWREENKKLYLRLRARGHSHTFLMNVFKEIAWGDRMSFLLPKPKVDSCERRIVLSTPYVPGFDIIRQIQSLSFSSFRNTAFTKKIFPPQGMWVAKAAPKLGNIIRKHPQKQN